MAELETLKLSAPDAYRKHLLDNIEHIDVLISNLEGDVILHSNSTCNPKRTRFLELCLDLAKEVKNEQHL